MGRWLRGSHPSGSRGDQKGLEVQPSHAQPEAPDPADRLLTVPNVLSLLRLAGVPLFLWLLLGPHYDLQAASCCPAPTQPGSTSPNAAPCGPCGPYGRA
jgi:hypothetical protein